MSEFSHRVAVRFQRKNASDRDVLTDAASYLEEALTHLQDAADILEAPVYAGTTRESIADVYGSAAKVTQDLKKLMVSIKNDKNILSRLAQQARTAGTGARLDNPTKKRINDQISRLIKNRYFEKAQQGLAGILEIMANFDIELNDIVNSFVFTQPDGRMTQDLAFSNAEQPMAPVPIRNAMLVFSFHQMESGRFEITAYVS
jgi:hypothetical protein